jgi:hypothetical protein
MEEFASLIYDTGKSDRDNLVAVSGFTGEGKSTFSTKLQKAYSKISGTEWSFDRMTWSREELMGWIDGPNRLPEYSAILPDELFLMFYRRNWYEEDQIKSIATFNMCRDRHIFLCGNVPSFWDLDAGFTKRVRYYVYIPYRGIAWVHTQENNPFILDPWNISENKKLFRKNKNPYQLKNFVCEIRFDDWGEEEKKEYLKIRNAKRLAAVEEYSETKNKGVKYSKVKNQRNSLIRWAYQTYKVPQKTFVEITGLSHNLISDICNRVV